jgi:hypothetical protein
MAKPILAEQHYTCTVCGGDIVQTFTSSETRVVHWRKGCAAWDNPRTRPACLVLAIRGQERSATDAA